MNRYGETCIAILATAWFGAVIGGQPGITIDLWPSQNQFYIGEKNVVNTTFRFPAKSYKDVMLILYPTVDIPDVAITKVTRVTVGKKLLITGSTEPVMDGGIKSLQDPGNALSCQLEIGDVFKLEDEATPEEESIMVQYEAVVMGDVPEFSEPGHKHELGASVQVDGSIVSIGFKAATFSYRSLPLLFRTHTKERQPYKTSVVEMKMKAKKVYSSDQNVFAY